MGTSNPNDLYPAALVSQASKENGGMLTITGCTSTGTISTDGKYAAGLVGIVQGTASITDCVSSVTINSSVSGDGTHGGIVATNATTNGTSISIEGCVFDGKMLTVGTTGSTGNCGGFVGRRNTTVTITNSLYAPATLGTGETEVIAGTSNPSATFCRNGAGATVTNCYYTRALGTAQGKAKRTVSGGDGVTVEAVSPIGSPVENGTYTVSGIKAYAKGITRGGTFYYGSEDEVSLTLSNTATGTPTGYQYGYTASAGTLDGTTQNMPDGDVTISVSTDHLASTGQPVSVSYIDANGESRNANAVALDGSETALGSYDQDKWYFVGTSFSHTGRIECHGNVHIILCDGKTMNVDGGSSAALWCSPGNFYFYGQSGQTGTLNTIGRISANGTAADEGTITINGGIINATGDYGIDGYNLVAINGGIVTATGNDGDGIWSNGTITLGWSNMIDHIYANSYNGSISVKSGQALVDDDGNILSGDLTATAVDGKTLSPAAAAVTFAPEGYATYYNGKNDAILPAGVKARIVTADNGGTLTYATIADGDTDNNVVPAGTAIMLQTAASTEAQTKALTLKAKSATYTGTNLLHGSDTETTTTGSGKHYKLSYNTTGTDICWYWGTADGAAFETAAHKAWLVLPNANARSFIGLPGGDSESTGITTTDLTDYTDSDAWYTIDGRKLSGMPTKAGLYIVNGKKIVIK